MKAGRNDACPCGSGKKYKNCCLEKSAAAPATIAETTPEHKSAMLMNAANSLRQQGQFADALALFERAIALTPNEGTLFFNRGMLYYSQGQLNAMQADFERAATLAPENAEMFYKMGIPYVHLGQH